jgi:hypothetical protein
VTIGGKTFANQTDLLNYVEQDVLGSLAYADTPVEITNEQHKDVLIALFQHASDNFQTSNIQKILYGPQASSGGAVGSFQISRLVPCETSTDEFQKQREEKTGLTFAVPSRRVVSNEEVSYVDAIRKLCAETVFRSEQGYIRSVNGVFFPCLYAAVEGLVRRYPLLQHEVLQGIIKHFPHHRSEKLTLICSARNLLSLAAVIPGFERQVIQFIVDLLARLDCEMRAGRTREKLDQIMELFILYINFKLGIDNKDLETGQEHNPEVCPLEGVRMAREGKSPTSSKGQKARESFVSLLLQTFSERVIKIEKPNVVHFVYYYISTLTGEFDWIKEAFLEQLILNIHDKSLLQHIKLHSLYYLFSFLRASNFVTGIILHTALTYLLSFLIDHYPRYLRRHPQLDLKRMAEMSKHHLNSRRTENSENTSPIRDDIFIFCFQSCLDLFVSKRHLLSESQATDLVLKFDELSEKTVDFIKFCLAESESFFHLFRNLRDHIEPSKTKAILDDMSILSQAPQSSSRFVSPKAKTQPTPITKKIILKDIDYLPFRPLRMRFYRIFISPYLLPACFSESLGDKIESPFDSSMSMVETSATEQHGGKLGSPLCKRPPCREVSSHSPVPQKKYST